MHETILRYSQIREDPYRGNVIISCAFFRCFFYRKNGLRPVTRMELWGPCRWPSQWEIGAITPYNWSYGPLFTIVFLGGPTLPPKNLWRIRPFGCFQLKLQAAPALVPLWHISPIIRYQNWHMFPAAKEPLFCLWNWGSDFFWGWIDGIGCDSPQQKQRDLNHMKHVTIMYDGLVFMYRTTLVLGMKMMFFCKKNMKHGHGCEPWLHFFGGGTDFVGTMLGYNNQTWTCLGFNYCLRKKHPNN